MPLSSTAQISTVHGQPAIQLKSPDGASATILLFGAQVISWVPAGGTEQLFLSPKAVLDQKTAVRGGIPICFPQFADRGPLIKHGFVRQRHWKMVEVRQSGHDALAVLQCSDDDQSRASWPHGFDLELTARIGGNRLDVELSVTNTGMTTFEFSAALHTYLLVDSLPYVRIDGLQGLTYLDSTQGGERCTEGSSELSIHREIDRIYLQSRQPLVLREPGRRIQVTSQGFDDAVIWNPGATKNAKLSDMPEDGYQHMMCIEAAAVEQPITLSAGEEWVGRQTLISELSD